MKRGTPRHPKVLELASLLNIPRYAAVGLLEMLWHFTAEFALDGNIGKFSDEAIKEALCYDGASMMLVNSLIEARLIDACQCHRLRVHDWPDHADQTVRRVLSGRNQSFIPCYDDASTVLGSSKLPLPLPIPIANTCSARPDARSKDKKKFEYDGDFLDFWAAYPRKVGKGQAFKAWQRAKQNGLPKLPVVLEALKKQKKSRAWTKDAGEYIPHPTTWINGARWDDSTEIEAEEEEFYDPLPDLMKE
jgi:hypothetical protein